MTRRRGFGLALVAVALVLLAKPALAAQPVDRPTDAQWAQILASTGQWPDLQVALAVMFAESGGNPQARNPSGARGPWQFMPNTLADDACAYDPICSTKAALDTYNRRGWQPWEAYTAGAYTRQLARAAAALAAAGQTPGPQSPLPQLPPAPQPGPPPDNRGMGVDGLVPQPPIQHGNQPFLYERYPPLDYSPLNVDTITLLKSSIAAVLGLADPATMAMNISLNGAASLLTDALVLVGVLCTRLLAWSLRVDLLAGADGPLNSVVGGLAQGFYQPLVPFLLTLVLAWLIYTWLIRRRTTRGFMGAGWMFAALVMASIYFAAPGQVLDNASAFTAGISRMILSTVGAADAQVAQRGAPTVASGPADDAELRLFADRFWSVYIYQPWTTAEFGKVDPKGASGTPLGVSLLDKKTGRSNSFDGDLNQQPQEVQDWYNGAKGGDRLAIVALALVVAAIAGFAFLAAAVARLASALVFLALLMALPVILLMALHPTIGRKILVRWLELAVGALWRQVVYSLFLAIMVVLVGVVAAASAAGGWGLVALCQLAAMAGILIFRKPLLAIFGQIPGRGTRIEHVGSSKAAQITHQQGERLRQHQRLTVPAFARRGKPVQAATNKAMKEGSKKATKAVAEKAAVQGGAQAAGVAATGGWALVGAAAVKTGQAAIRKGEDAKRGLQSAAGAFVVDGKQGKPSSRRMPEKSLGADGWTMVGHGWTRMRSRTPQFAAKRPGNGRSSLGEGRPRHALPAGAVAAGPSISPRRSLPPSEGERIQNRLAQEGTADLWMEQPIIDVEWREKK